MRPCSRGGRLCLTGCEKGQLTCPQSRSPDPAHPACAPLGSLRAGSVLQTQLGLAFHVLWKWILLDNLSPVIFSEGSSASVETLEYLFSCLSCRCIFMAQFDIALMFSQLVPPPPHLNGREGRTHIMFNPCPSASLHCHTPISVSSLLSPAFTFPFQALCKVCKR